MVAVIKVDPDTGARSEPERRWILEQQGKHFCECGCGAPLTIIRQHRYKRGIPRMLPGHETVKWIRDNQGQHLCQCGCGEPIRITKYTKGNGIPRYIRSHASGARSYIAGWIKDNQGKHFCSCGCGQEIRIVREHKFKGIPMTRPGHRHGLPIAMWVEQEQGKHLCSCRCGVPIPITIEHRKHGIPKFILGHNAIGPSNPAWKGGTSKTYASRRGRLQPKHWSRNVMARDGHKCQWPGCGRTEGLHAHHLIPFGKDPSIVAELWNGITLCELCHYKVKGRELQYADFLLSLLAGNI